MYREQIAKFSFVYSQLKEHFVLVLDWFNRSMCVLVAFIIFIMFIIFEMSLTWPQKYSRFKFSLVVISRHILKMAQ